MSFPALRSKNLQISRPSVATSSYTLTAAQASFALSGQTTLLKIGWKLLAALGTFTFTGQTAILKVGWKMLATFGSYIFTGYDITVSSLTNGLQAYWKLDESSGTAVDATGNGRDLTNNGTTPYAAAKLNNGADFGTSNTTKYLRNATALGLNGASSFTMNFWVKLRTEQPNATLCVFADLFAGTGGSQQRVEIFYTGGSGTATLTFRRGDGSTDVDVTRTGQLGTSNWQMLTLTGSGSALTAYYNGVLLGTAAYSGSGTYGIAERFTIGADSSNTATGFCTCYMDEVGMWNRVLTQIEIDTLYNDFRANAYPSFTVDKRTGIKAYYKLDESSGSALDSTNSAYTLTNLNTTSYSTGLINNGVDGGSSNTNKGLYRDGDAAVGITNIQFATAWTVNLWMKETTRNASGGILAGLQVRSGTNRRNARMESVNGLIELRMYDGASNLYSSGVTVATGGWHMVTYGYNGTAFFVYVDGTLSLTQTRVLSADTDSSAGAFALLTDRQGGSQFTGNQFSGLIDEVGVWARVLTQAEVTSLYHTGTGIQYPFDHFVYSILAAFASFTLTGQTTALKVGWKMLSVLGTYALTGQTALLKVGRKMLAVLGTYALTGQAAILHYGRSMAAAFGTFTLTGQAAILKIAMKMAAVFTTYNLTGFAAILVGGARLVAGLGSYALTGQAATLRIAIRMLAALGTYALTGFSAVIAGGKILIAGLGSYTVTGQNSLFHVALKMLAAVGTFALNGQAAILRIGKIMTAVLGTYALTGQTALFHNGMKMLAGLGSYTLTGFAATLRFGKKLIVTVGTYALTGQAAIFRFGKLMAAGIGRYTVTGFAVKFSIFWKNLVKTVVSFVNPDKTTKTWINPDKSATSTINNEDKSNAT